MLKVIANLIAQSEHTEELMEVKKAFLLDLINMSRTGRENRRTILQLSVWQVVKCFHAINFDNSISRFSYKPKIDTFLTDSYCCYTT